MLSVANPVIPLSPAYRRPSLIASHRKYRPSQGRPREPLEAQRGEAMFRQPSAGLSFPFYPAASPEGPGCRGTVGETPGGTSEGNGTGSLGGRRELGPLEVGTHSRARRLPRLDAAGPPFIPGLSYRGQPRPALGASPLPRELSRAGCRLLSSRGLARRLGPPPARRLSTVDNAPQKVKFKLFFFFFKPPF